MRDRSGFIPTNLLHVPCPAGLHRATYERLIREYNRVILAWLGRKEPERVTITFGTCKYVEF